MQWQTSACNCLATCFCCGTDYPGEEKQPTGEGICQPSFSLVEVKAGSKVLQSWICHVRFYNGPRPTFVWTNDPNVKTRVASLGAQIVDTWQEATCHLVESFSTPGQRVSWAAKLGGHLIITNQLAEGPWIQCLGLTDISCQLRWDSAKVRLPSLSCSGTWQQGKLQHRGIC